MYSGKDPLQFFAEFQRVVRDCKASRCELDNSERAAETARSVANVETIHLLVQKERSATGQVSVHHDATVMDRQGPASLLGLPQERNETHAS
ncbi:hypothetical protein K470DRAFT_258749 [Piedraia hortae CBS 480.64]|uniref:Uncharacterized protein n=1 Tax=Piedraia hortae CBS 480.64 TaxID=1314780 RepID=A0A6A7BWI0_9PEZI|nr:hypothetical protein K470DRAFT_258749 [Piedraia hortae CBS 480.64]